MIHQIMQHVPAMLIVTGSTFVLVALASIFTRNGSTDDDRRNNDHENLGSE